MSRKRTSVQRACLAQALFLSGLAGLGNMALLSGCGLDASPNAAGQDLTPPSIDVVRTEPPLQSGDVCGEPVGLRIIEGMTGDTLSVEMDFRDDVALAQYKIDVHHNFDCHSHAKRAADAQPWSLVALRDIDGQRRLATEKLAVPPLAKTGFYHLMIRSLDAAGNEAPYVELNVRLRNALDTVPPVLTLENEAGESLAAGDSLFLARQDSLILQGRLQDNRPMLGAEGRGRLELSYRDASGTAYSITQVLAEAAAGLDFRVAYRFPPFLAADEYTLLIEGFDAVNNATRMTLHVNLTP